MIESLNPEKENTEKQKAKPEFKNIKEAEDYLTWKQEVPEVIRRIVEGNMLGNTVAIETDLPLTKEFLEALQTSLKSGFSDEVCSNPRILNLLRPLSRIKTEGGSINLFEVIVNPETSWGLRKKLYDQIKPTLDWTIDRDLSESMKKVEEGFDKGKKGEAKVEGEKETEKDDSKHEVPPSNDESISSMEAGGEKKEGKPKEHFTVNPYYGGYAKSNIYTRFDLDKVHFIPEATQLVEPGQEIDSYDRSSSRVMYGLIRGGEPLAIPMYYNFVIDQASLETNAPEGSARFLRDENGLWYLSVDKLGVWNYRFVIGRRLTEVRERNITKEKRKKEEKPSDVLPKEVIEKVRSLQKEGLPRMKLARELVKFIRGNLQYSNSHDAWEKYSSKPASFFTEIWSGKEADCHVANTIAWRTLIEAGLACRFINGHYVKNRNEAGEAIMHSGSGHAWLEVWDNIGEKWLRLDATPKGDPTVDEEEQEKDLADPEIKDEGDYGEDDEFMREDNVKKEIDKMKGKDKSQRKERKISLEEDKFAKEAGCTVAQAKEVLDAFERVRKIKDEQGRSISEGLIDEWQRIVEERKIQKSEYRGPVRMREGEILTDPVSAVIDLHSNEFNPTGFEREQYVEKAEYDFGGINVLFSFDLSGSMSQSDSVSGRSKSDVQRDTAFLFVDSLMQCAFLHRRIATETDLLPLKIMATVASNTGEIKLHLTDKWGPKEQWQFYSALNQLASGGTPIHETLEYIRQAIEREDAELTAKRTPKDKIPINYVMETSDGAPDDLAETLVKHDELAGKKNTVVRAYVIGGQVMNRPEYTPLDSFSKLAQTMAEDITTQFRKLRPKIK